MCITISQNLSICAHGHSADMYPYQSIICWNKFYIYTICNINDIRYYSVIYSNQGL